MPFFKKVDPKKQVHLAIAHMNSGDYMEAMKSCEKLLQKYPTHAEGARLMGQVCEKLGNDRKASTYYRIAVEQNPIFSNYLVYGNVCQRLDESAKAAELLERGLVASPDSIELRGLLAEVYEARGIWTKAVAMRKGIYDKRPEDADALFLLARCTFRAKLLEETAMLCTRLLNQTPDHAKGLRLFAECMLYRGMHDRAIELFGKALDAQPEDWEGHFQLAELYESQSRDSEAVRHYQYCIRHNNGHPQAHRKLIDYYKQKHEWLEAEIVIKHYINVEGSQELLAELGDVSFAQEEYDASATAYQQARSAGKAHEELDAKYVSAAVRAGRAHETIDLAHRLASGNVFNVEFQHLFALCLIATDQKDRATELVKSVTASADQFPEFAALRTKLLEEAGVLPTSSNRAGV